MLQKPCKGKGRNLQLKRRYYPQLERDPLLLLRTLQGRRIQDTVIAADGTPAVTVTSAVIATHAQENTPGQMEPMDVSQPTEQLEQEAESQSVDQQYSQDTASVGTVQQQPADHLGTVFQEEMQESQRL